MFARCTTIICYEIRGGSQTIIIIINILSFAISKGFAMSTEQISNFSKNHNTLHMLAQTDVF